MCLKCREFCSSRNVYTSIFHLILVHFYPNCLALHTSRIKGNEETDLFSPTVPAAEIIICENFFGGSQHLAALPEA